MFDKVFERARILNIPSRRNIKGRGRERYIYIYK